MQANKKEQKCIDYSNKIRQGIVRWEISNLKQNQIPLLLSQEKFKEQFWSDYSVTVKLSSPFQKRIIKSFFFISYLFFTPIVIAVRIVQMITGNKEFNAQVKNIKEFYKLDNQVSSNKSFEQLWSDKGLRTDGLAHRELYGFSSEEQIDCMRYCFLTLYGKEDKDFDSLSDVIEKQITEKVRAFYKKDPDGHITPFSTQDLLPKEIDKKFGLYIG